MDQSFFTQEPNFVWAPPVSCQPPMGQDDLIAPCLGYEWDTTIEEIQKADVLCPDASGAVVKVGTKQWLAAVPTKKDVFCFSVYPGTFRLLHLHWNLECNNIALRIRRSVMCRADCCEVEQFTTCWPRKCPFTILPPGRYQLWLDASRVFVDEGMIGTSVAVKATLEYITRDFVLAAQIAGQ